MTRSLEGRTHLAHMPLGYTVDSSRANAGTSPEITGQRLGKQDGNAILTVTAVEAGSPGGPWAFDLGAVLPTNWTLPAGNLPALDVGVYSVMIADNQNTGRGTLIVTLQRVVLRFAGVTLRFGGELLAFGPNSGA